MNAEGGLERRERDELVPSELDFEQHLNALSPVVQSSARSAAVLLLPTTFGDEHPGGYFPKSTPDVFRYLREHLPEGITVEAAVDDEDYAEYSFRSIDIILPILLITDLTTIDVVTALLVDYVKRVLARDRQEGGYVRSNVHVVVSSDGSVVLHHAYEGPADTFERSMADLSLLIEDRQGTTEDRADPHT